MSSPYEAWADSFHFSEDLKALEALYQEQHQAALRQQLASPDMETAIRTTLSEPGFDLTNEALIASLSSRIARHLEATVTNPDVMAKLLHVAKLERDNQIMARQIQELRTHLEAAEREVQTLHALQHQYRPLVGPLYVKAM
jgi:hypothetical protein